MDHFNIESELTGYYLVLDTVSDGAMVALFNAKRHKVTLQTAFKYAKLRGQAEYIIPMIEEVMHLAKSGPDQLKGIIVNQGPGSYTAIRIGLAAAEGLAIGLAIPIIGINSLSTYLHGDKLNNSTLCVLEAGKMERIVAFDPDKPAFVAPNDLPDWINAQRGKRDEPLILIGNSGKEVAELLQKAGLKITIASYMPSLMVMMKIGLDRLRHEGVNLTPPEPYYLRAADVILPIAKQKSKS